MSSAIITSQSCGRGQPPAVVAEIARLLPTMPGEDVASIVGVDRRTVFNTARRHGIPIRPRGQPSVGVRTVYALRAPWPFKPRQPSPFRI